MGNSGGHEITLSESVNRALNLLVATALGLTGLTFGSDLFAETDPIDKLDNTLLAVVGVVAVVWYFTGRHWAQRSRVPMVLAAVALLVQLVGVAIEIGDPTALGDDIPGMVLFVPLLVIVTALYSINGRYLKALPAQAT